MDILGTSGLTLGTRYWLISTRPPLGISPIIWVFTVSDSCLAWLNPMVREAPKVVMACYSKPLPYLAIWDSKSSVVCFYSCSCDILALTQLSIRTLTVSQRESNAWFTCYITVFINPKSCWGKCFLCFWKTFLNIVCLYQSDFVYNRMTVHVVCLHVVRIS